MNKKLIIIIIIIIIVALIIDIIVYKNNLLPFSITDTSLESAAQGNCFDYIDNDNDGMIDLHDEDCTEVSTQDDDGDGIINVIEYEEGTYGG